MEERLMIMLGTIFVLLDGVFLLLLFAWLVNGTEAGKDFGSKAYHMLLLFLMKADIAIAHGMEYVSISLSHIFKSYRHNTIGAQRIRQKEQRLREFRQDLHGSREVYKKKEKYNRKILE